MISLDRHKPVITQARNLLVCESFAGHFLDDVHLVIIAQGSGQFLVGHVGAVLLLPPQLRQTSGVDDAEDQVHVAALPTHVLAAVAVLQQLVDELPQQPAV